MIRSERYLLLILINWERYVVTAQHINACFLVLLLFILNAAAAYLPVYVDLNWFVSFGYQLMWAVKRRQIDYLFSKGQNESAVNLKTKFTNIHTMVNKKFLRLWFGSMYAMINASDYNFGTKEANRIISLCFLHCLLRYLCLLVANVCVPMCLP